MFTTAVKSSDTIRSFVEAGRYLLRQAGLDTAESEAKLIARHVWNTDDTGLLCASLDVTAAHRKKFFDIVKERAKGKPLQYILGTVGFYDHDFEVRENVLIPRPETEILVDKALDAVNSKIEKTRSVLDMCCGSGAAGLSVLSKLPDSILVGADISPDALSLSDANARHLGLSARAAFVYSDLFAEFCRTKPFDLIICNPPYVTEAEYAELDASVRDFEPRLALVGGMDGLDFYRKIIAEADKYLEPGASIVFEIGALQKDAVCEIAKQAGWCREIKTYVDLAGRDRVVALVKAGAA